VLSDPSDTGHETAHKGFVEQRQLQRYAGFCSLWALGVGAVISSDGPMGRLFRAY